VFNLQLDVPKDAQLVSVVTTDRRGLTPEELSEQCVKRIISVSEGAHPAIRDQAAAFSKQLEVLVAHYMRQAIHSDRTTVYNALNDAGHPELAQLLRRL
jgi:hypothetical protein